MGVDDQLRRQHCPVPVLAPRGALEFARFQARVGELFGQGCPFAFHWQCVHCASHHKCSEAVGVATGASCSVGSSDRPKAFDVLAAKRRGPQVFGQSQNFELTSNVNFHIGKTSFLGSYEAAVTMH